MSSIADARKIAAMRAMAGKEFESPETLAKMTARASGTKVPLPERPIGQQVEQELAAAPPEPRKGDSIMSQEGRLKEVGATGMVSAARRAAAERAFLKDMSPWGSADMAYEGGKNVVSGVKEGSPKKVAIGAAQGAAGTGMLGLDMAGLGLLTTRTGPLLRSKLADAVASLKPGQKIATQGLRAELTKRGVKKAEMNATQLDSLVKTAEERGQKSVSREEILDHIEDNPLEFEEVARGIKPPTPELLALGQERDLAATSALESIGERMMPLKSNTRPQLNLVQSAGNGSQEIDWNQIMHTPGKISTIWPKGFHHWVDYGGRSLRAQLRRLGSAAQFPDQAYPAFKPGSSSNPADILEAASNDLFHLVQGSPSGQVNYVQGGKLLEDAIEVTGRIDRALEGIVKAKEEAMDLLDLLYRNPDLDPLEKADVIAAYRLRKKGVTPDIDDVESLGQQIYDSEVGTVVGKRSPSTYFLGSRQQLLEDKQALEDVIAHYTHGPVPTGVYANRLPAREPWSKYKEKLLSQAEAIDDIEASPVWQEYLDVNGRYWDEKQLSETIPTQWDSYGAIAPGGDNYGETTLSFWDKDLADNPYRSDHWPDVKNPVVHFRHTDRLDTQGRRILFVDEIQSDWHQQGRLRGYSPEENAAILKKLSLESNKLDDAMRQAKNEAEGWSLMAQREVSPIAKTVRDRREQRALALYATLHKKTDIVRKRIRRAHSGPVPKGVLKGTKEWTGLAIKRIMRKAAEEGYQGVAFTRGKDAMRYSQMKPEGAYYYDTIVPSVAAKIAAPKGVSKAKIDKTTIRIPQAPGEVTLEEFPVVWLTDAVKGRAMLPYDKFAAVLAAGAAGAVGAKALQDRKGEEEQ